VGTYATPWGSIEVVIRNQQLQIVSLDWMGEKPSILKPTDKPHVFTIEQDNQSNEIARFEFDADGKLVKCWYRNEYAVPKR
jgi:hypothetical protein